MVEDENNDTKLRNIKDAKHMKKFMLTIFFAWAFIAASQEAKSSNNSILSFKYDDVVHSGVNAVVYDHFFDIIENLKISKNLIDNPAVRKKLYDESIIFNITSILPADCVLSWALHFSGLGLREEEDTFFITEGEIVGEKSRKIANLYLRKDGSVEKQINEILNNPINMRIVYLNLGGDSNFIGISGDLLFLHDIPVLISPEINLSELRYKRINFIEMINNLEEDASLRQLLEELLHLVGWQYEVRGGIVFISDDPDNPVDYSEVAKRPSELFISRWREIAGDRIRVETHAVPGEKVKNLPKWNPKDEDSVLPLSPGEAGRIAIESLPDDWDPEAAWIKSIMLENRFSSYLDAPFWYYEVTVRKDRIYPSDTIKIYVLFDGSVVEPTTEYIRGYYSRPGNAAP